MRGATSFGLNIDDPHMAARTALVNATGGRKAIRRRRRAGDLLYNGVVFANRQDRHAVRNIWSPS
jgi:hypothetical protein